MTRKSFFTTALSLLGFAALAPRAKAEPATAGSVPNTNPATRNPQRAAVESNKSRPTIKAALAWVEEMAEECVDYKFPMTTAVREAFMVGYVNKSSLIASMASDTESSLAFRNAFNGVNSCASLCTLPAMVAHVCDVRSAHSSRDAEKAALANYLCEVIRMGMIADPFYPDFLPELGIKPSIVAGVPLA